MHCEPVHVKIARREVKLPGVLHSFLTVIKGMPAERGVCPPPPPPQCMGLRAHAHVLGTWSTAVRWGGCGGGGALELVPPATGCAADGIP